VSAVNSVFLVQLKKRMAGDWAGQTWVKKNLGKVLLSGVGAMVLSSALLGKENLGT